MPNDSAPSPVAGAGDDLETPIRDRLIEVASAHFAEHGLQGASQRAIQREVGVNPGAANYHFGSKEALYLAVIEDALRRIQEGRRHDLEEIPTDEDASVRLRLLMRAYLAPMLHEAETQRGHNYLRILVAQLSHADIALEAMERYVEAMRERYVEQLSQMFPAVSRQRIYQVLRTVLCLAAIMPIQASSKALSHRRIVVMIDDATEIGASIFERLCRVEED